ncbi:mannosyl-glycoprotein endo-beta-N-acetylglucosamidase, partial [Oceanobacillus caeni]
TSEEHPTSKLGHIRHSNVKIYNKDNLSSYKLAGSTYTNAVYYIKKQKNIGNKKYYLISKQPSSVNGVVGWVESGDLSIHTHVGVDKNSKTFYIKGTGSAYSKAWGGSKDLVYKNMSR